MAKSNNNLIRHFRIALSSAEITMTDFAALHNVMHVAINRVLRGKSTSKRLQTLIEQFIADQFAALKIEYRKAA